MKPPRHTCPWIDQLQKLVRRNMLGDDRRQGLALCEQLRGANLQLRVAYTDSQDDLRALQSVERARLASTLYGDGGDGQGQPGEGDAASGGSGCAG